MEPIIRTNNTVELTVNGKHCVMIGNVKGIADGYIIKLAEWANTWDYDRITMWKKSDSMEPGYFIRDSPEGKYRVHVLDEKHLNEVFDHTAKDNPEKISNWKNKDIIAYVDWFID